MKLDKFQRKHLADKLMDTANVVLASLVIAGILEKTAQWWLVLTGVTVYFLLLAVTTAMRKGG